MEEALLQCRVCGVEQMKPHSVAVSEALALRGFCLDFFVDEHFGAWTLTFRVGLSPRTHQRSRRLNQDQFAEEPAIFRGEDRLDHATRPRAQGGVTIT